MVLTPNDYENAAILRAWVFQCARATRDLAAKRLAWYSRVNSACDPGEEIDLTPTRAKFDAAVGLMAGCRRHAKDPLGECFIGTDWEVVFSADVDDIFRELYRRGAFNVPKFESVK